MSGALSSTLTPVWPLTADIGVVSGELQGSPVVGGLEVGAGLATAEGFHDGGIAFVTGVVQGCPACSIWLANEFVFISFYHRSCDFSLIVTEKTQQGTHVACLAELGRTYFQ